MSSLEELQARRFDQEATWIVAHVGQRAASRSMTPLETKTVIRLALWSILRWERKVGLIALQTMCKDVGALEHQIDSLLHSEVATNPVVLQMPDNVLVFAKSGKPVPSVDPADLLQPLLLSAEEASRALQHSWVGTEHILLAIIHLADSELSAVLEQHGVNAEEATKVIRELLPISACQQ